MKVTRLPTDPGPAAWNAILPAATSRPPLQEDAIVDWLIIGAGFTGLSAARRLSELHPGDRKMVLDATRVAEGPAGRNSGIMIDVPHDLTTTDYGGNAAAKDQRDIRLNRAGIAYALDGKSAYGMSDETIDICGKINGAITARGIAHNSAYADHLDRLGEPYNRLDAAAMQARTGVFCYIDGLYTPGTVMIQPAMYMRALVSGVETNRVQFHELSPVLEINSVGPHWRAKTPNAVVTAPKVMSVATRFYLRLDDPRNDSRGGEAPGW